MRRRKTRGHTTKVASRRRPIERLTNVCGQVVECAQPLISTGNSDSISLHPHFKINEVPPKGALSGSNLAGVYAEKKPSGQIQPAHERNVPNRRVTSSLHCDPTLDQVRGSGRSENEPHRSDRWCDMGLNQPPRRYPSFGSRFSDTDHLMHPCSTRKQAPPAEVPVLSDH